MSSLPRVPLEGDHSYADYRTWDSSNRYELLNGQVWAMSPGPTWDHQELVGEVFAQLKTWLKGKPCKPFVAPLDVFLPKGDEAVEEPSDQDLDRVRTVLQPDAGIVCDPKKILRGKGIWGAPDLILEVLSPSTVLRDLNLKKQAYESAGVREYWILDGHAEFLIRCVLDGQGRFDPGRTFEGKAEVESAAFPGLTVNLGHLQAVLAGKA